VVQAFRSLGLPQSVQDHVCVKERERGYDEATFVESFVILNAAGGECPEDFKRLREDVSLTEMLGHEVPSPTATLQFLYAFHAEAKIEEAQQRRLPGEIAYIPEEPPALEGLGRVNRDLVQRCGERCPDQRIATVDQDATIIASRKREAKPTYEGERGYQPMLAVWAETSLVLAEEFRDGNVPAMMAPLNVAQAAFAALPGTVREYYYRGDSACHQKGLVNWLRNEKREGGPQGRIGFALSARMGEALHAAIQAVPEAKWQPYSNPQAEEIREWADVPFVPGEKAGTIELVHDVIKDELSGGVLPSKYFGAHADWLRLAVIAHNVLTALKRLALPAELLTARPKRLRFLFFNMPGRLVHHARRLLLRVAGVAERIAAYREGLRLLPLPS
jgi:hypothetical protein